MHYKCIDSSILDTIKLSVAPLCNSLRSSAMMSFTDTGPDVPDVPGGPGGPGGP